MQMIPIDDQKTKSFGSSGEFCIAIEVESEETNSVRNQFEMQPQHEAARLDKLHSRDSDTCKGISSKRLKKFNNTIELYRKIQPKAGKETKVNEHRQAQIPSKPLKMVLQKVEERNVWNPYILSEKESKTTNFSV